MSATERDERCVESLSEFYKEYSIPFAIPTSDLDQFRPTSIRMNAANGIEPIPSIRPIGKHADQKPIAALDSPI